ncbi:MAG: glycosyltransferase [Calothrix sp. C42_A2020_038]|nr:glycosyltransferase [Calothrix sp. C42_A2020_038]
MRILYVAMKYDYGKPEQGYSFEHCNFYDSLQHMGHTILYFDFMTLMQKHGRRWMNRRLIEVVKAEKPDLMFTCLYTDQFDPKTIRYISKKTNTVTLNWFCDDHWRFDDFSQYWAPCFNWVVTTDQSALSKYAAIGYKNVIKSQWGSNHFLYKKLDLPLKYDVTFVGQAHGDRKQVIEQLQQAGIKVEAWGNGWENGRVSQAEMIEIFNSSRINLNLTNASVPQSPKPYSRYLSSFPLKLIFRVSAKTPLKKWLNYDNVGELIEKLIPAAAGNSQSSTQQYSQQIKGRNFEVPSCGGLILTSPADNLEDYYILGQEIICFDDTNDLINKIKYYLEYEQERHAIAQAGYERTLKEHTYTERFNSIFKHIGLLENTKETNVVEIGQTIDIT